MLTIQYLQALPQPNSAKNDHVGGVVDSSSNELDALSAKLKASKNEVEVLKEKMTEMQEQIVTSSKSVDLGVDQTDERRTASAISKLEERVSELHGQLTSLKDAKAVVENEQKDLLEDLKKQKEKSDITMGKEMEKLQQRIKELEQESTNKDEKEQQLRTKSESEMSELKHSYENAIETHKKATSLKTSQLHEKNEKLARALDLQTKKTEGEREGPLRLSI